MDMFKKPTGGLSLLNFATIVKCLLGLNGGIGYGTKRYLGIKEILEKVGFFFIRDSRRRGLI